MLDKFSYIQRQRKTIPRKICSVPKEKLGMIFCLRSHTHPAKSSDYRVSQSWTSLQREIKTGVPLLGIFREDWTSVTRHSSLAPTARANLVKFTNKGSLNIFVVNIRPDAAKRFSAIDFLLFFSSVIDRLRATIATALQKFPFSSILFLSFDHYFNKNIVRYYFINNSYYRTRFLPILPVFLPLI